MAQDPTRPLRSAVSVISLAPLAPTVLAVSTPTALVAGPRALFTTDADGEAVNQHRYAAKHHVYLNGGPEGSPSGLADGDYVFQVTDPSGKILLSSDPALCRIVARRDLVGGDLVDHAGNDGCHVDDLGPGAATNGLHDRNFSDITQTTVGTVWLHGLAPGSVELTAQAAGFDDGARDVVVQP